MIFANVYLNVVNALMKFLFSHIPHLLWYMKNLPTLQLYFEQGQQHSQESLQTLQHGCRNFDHKHRAQPEKCI